MAEPTDTNNFPQATLVPRKQRRISIVWIVPLFAAVVALGIAIQRIMSEGPTITIIFKSAQGVEAGKTFVKYKDVNIGQVTKVQLASDYRSVELTAKIDKSAAGLIVEDAKFWVVEPRVTLSGVSGLGTLLAGNYIGFEVGKSSKAQRKFVGLDIPPAITSDQAGRQFTLKADSLGSVGIGSPIYYRRLLAGQVIAYNLAPDGKGVDIKVFVNAPYDKYVNSQTRFWNASGLDISVGAGGVEVRTQSLVAVLAGGLAFDTPSVGSSRIEPVAANTVFKLYSDQTAALKQPDTIAAHYVLYFNESLRGLSVGAPVTLLGLPGGEVTDVGLDLDPKTMRVRGRVEIVSYPERLVAHLNQNQAAAGRAMVRSIQERHALMQRLVDQRGLRAQLRSGNLVTGQLFIALDFYPDAAKVKIDWSRDPVEIPVVPSTVQDLETKITGIVAKLDKLPYEAIGTDVTKVLVTLNQTLQDASKAVNRIDADVTPELKMIVGELRGTISSADGLLKSTDATLVGKDAPAQQDLRDALQEIARTARSLRVLTDYLERHPEALIRGKSTD
ncbi:MAG TPA: MlaD family protein [Candidatus Binatia bacterium]|nr:MlaD family protein [Candidatus Binatia bacterium]